MDSTAALSLHELPLEELGKRTDCGGVPMHRCQLTLRLGAGRRHNTRNEFDAKSKLQILYAGLHQD